MDSERSEKPLPATELSDLIGEFRFTQKYVYGTLLIVASVISWHSVTMAFLAPTVSFICLEGMDGNVSDLILKESNESLVEELTLRSPDDNQSDTCSQCSEWHFDHSVFANTLTEKLELICDRAWLTSFSSAIYMFGGLFGSILFGQVADSFGRRKTMLMLVIPTAAANLLMLFSSNYSMFAIGQFICGITGTGLFNANFVLMMEMVGAGHRSVLGTSIEFSFSTGHLLLLAAAYLTRDWFYIQTIAFVLTSCLAILIWFLPESPSWLLVSGRRKEAEAAILDIARKNKIPVENISQKTDALWEQIKQNKEKNDNSDRKYNVLDLFRTPRLRTWSFIILAYCFMTGFIFYGISLNIGIFGSDLFVDFFLSTVITYPAGAACIFAVRYFSRKKTLAGIALGTGAVCVAYMAAVLGPEWVHIAVVTLAKCLITPAFPVSNTYLAELFPTPIRSLGMGAGGLTARVGAAVAPFMKELGSLSDSRVPMAVFGGFAILCGLLVVLLPETKDRKLPDTIEEREQIEL